MKSKPTAVAPGATRPSDVRTPGARAEIRRVLLDHYDEHARRLPWRGEPDPYRILVSEVMLQQTRVDTVLDYYGAWLDRFPDLGSLAAADSDDVLQAWAGLGYYRRARNLHRAARVVRDRHGGALPTTYSGLRELPGVGEYTAGAVASIAFGEAVPAPDGNVKRVLARLFDEPDPKPAWLRDRAAELVDPDRPGDWNQALMELGATVCTPRRPACDSCPVAGWCGARAAGTQELRPAPAPKKAPREAVFAVAVVRAGERVLLTRRPVDGLLGGMWAFPEAELEGTEEAPAAARRIVDGLAREGLVADGLDELDALDASATPTDALPGALPMRPLPACEHRFTHLQATYLPYLVDGSAVDPVAERPDPARWSWVRPADAGGVALPVAQRRILESAGAALRRGRA